MGSLVSRMSSQENLAKGKGRAWGAERSSTEPFRKKDHATYLGAQRHPGGVGGVAHQQPGTRPPSTSGTSQRRSPAGGVPVTPLGATLLRPYGSSGRATARSVAGRRLPRNGGSPGRLRSRPEEPAGGRSRPVPPGANAIRKALGGRGKTLRPTHMLSRLAQAVVPWCSHDWPKRRGQRGGER